MSRAQGVEEWPFINGAIDVEAGRRQISRVFDSFVKQWRYFGKHPGYPGESGTSPPISFPGLQINPEINTEYEKGVVRRRFDHGGHDGVPVETETKGIYRNVAIVLKKCNMLQGMKFFSLEWRE